MMKFQKKNLKFIGQLILIKHCLCKINKFIIILELKKNYDYQERSMKIQLKI